MKMLKAMKKLWTRKKKRKLMPPAHINYSHPPPPYPPPPPPPCFCHFCQLPPLSYQVTPSAPPFPEEEDELLISSQQELVMILETTDQTQVHCQQQCRVTACRFFGCFIRCFLPCFGIEGEREREKQP